jgi:RNA polymerase sigma-70 factor (ECF subfamily)
MIDKGFSDSQLVSLYQTGNEEAFEMLLHRHKSNIPYRERQVYR